jgi:hypothetical protein
MLERIAITTLVNNLCLSSTSSGMIFLPSIVNSERDTLLQESKLKWKTEMSVSIAILS